MLLKVMEAKVKLISIQFTTDQYEGDHEAVEDFCSHRDWSGLGTSIFLSFTGP